MKPVTKELYQFIQNNFVNPQDYDLDFKTINEIVFFKNLIKKHIVIFDNFLIRILFVILWLLILFSGLWCFVLIIEYFINQGYETNAFFGVLLTYGGIYLALFLTATVYEKVSIKNIARRVALIILSLFYRSKKRFFDNNEKCFSSFINSLKTTINGKLENQKIIINETRWLYDKPLCFIREAQTNIKDFEVDFNNIKELNIAFELGLSDWEKRKSLYSYRQKEASDWQETEYRIQDAKTRLEDEITKREKDEIIRKEKEIESERIRNEKRLIALAEYEKKREEENRIYEENRQQRLKEAEVKRKEREIILRIEQENRKQQKEEERFQKFLKKQSEKTNNLLKPKSKINKQGIKVNKVISPDKLKEIVERKLTIGALGEQIVFEKLKSRLIGTIYQPLIEEFKHVSIEYGDGLGYDILAYNETGEKIYVEVKTTTAKYPSASFSKNEIAFATQFDINYVLFLIYNLNSDNFDYEEFVGYSNIKEKINFQPISYKLKIKNNLSNQENQLNQ